MFLSTQNMVPKFPIFSYTSKEFLKRYILVPKLSQIQTKLSTYACGLQSLHKKFVAYYNKIWDNQSQYILHDHKVLCQKRLQKEHHTTTRNYLTLESKI
jgi:hypothetical protein